MRFKVEDRNKWLCGHNTHQVVDSTTGKYVVVGPEYCCQLVADSMNVATGNDTWARIQSRTGRSFEAG